MTAIVCTIIAAAALVVAGLAVSGAFHHSTPCGGLHHPSCAIHTNYGPIT